MTQQEILTLASTADGREVLGDWYDEQGRIDVARLYRDELPQREGPLRKRVESLTDEERAQLDEHARRWIAVGRCIQPADRALAEAALLACYRLSRLHPPKRLIWASSPLVACLAGARAALQLSGDSVVYDSVSGAVRGEVFIVVQGVVRDLMHTDVHSAVHDAVHDSVTRELEDALCSAVGDTVHGAVHRAVHGVMRRVVHFEVSNTTHRAIGDAVCYGLHSAAGVAVADLWRRYLEAQFSVGSWWWGPAAVSYALDVLRLDIGRDMELRARAYAALCESCCLIWPHREFAILCERPSELELEGPGETLEEMRRQRLVRVAWNGWEVTP